MMENSKSIDNYNSLINKLEKINELKFTKILKKIHKNVICVGSGASFTTAYFSSKIFNKYFDKNAVAMTPRELLNVDFNTKPSIIIYSYSGTSNDIKYIKNKFENVIVVTGRNIDEFIDKENIFSYYLNEPYERGLILYENIIMPITLLLNEVKEFKKIIEYEINNYNKYNLKISEMNKIAIFTGDFTTVASYDFTDKILETGILKFDLYEKKEFSHGQYNYFINNDYDSIIYFKQKNVSDYEKELMKTLNRYNTLIIIESDFNGLFASYDLLFKSFVLFNKIKERKKIKLYNEQFKNLYSFEGDFS